MRQTEAPGPTFVQRTLGGGVLLAFGMAMLVIGMDYPVGRLTQMGPGFVPRLIGMGICALALVILVIDHSSRSAEPPSTLGWRGLIFVSAAILAFAGSVDSLGLVPAMFLAVAVSKLADRRNTPVGILVYAVLATLAGWILFSGLLELPIRTFWR